MITYLNDNFLANLLLGETDSLDFPGVNSDPLAAEFFFALLECVPSSYDCFPRLSFSMDCFLLGVEDPLRESCHLGLLFVKVSLSIGGDGFSSWTQHPLDGCLFICPLDGCLSRLPFCRELGLENAFKHKTFLFPTLALVFSTVPVMSVCPSCFLIVVFLGFHHGLYRH